MLETLGFPFACYTPLNFDQSYVPYIEQRERERTGLVIHSDNLIAASLHSLFEVTSPDDAQHPSIVVNSRAQGWT